MAHCFYLLLTDPYSLEQRIRIYPDREQAESARSNSIFPDAEIRRVSTGRWAAEDLGQEPLHVVLTREDDGLRIHGVFTTVREADAFLDSICTESIGHRKTAWPAGIPMAMRA